LHPKGAFLREGLNDFFTKLSYGPKFIDDLNSIKSKIIVTGKYKAVSEIRDTQIQQEVKNYLLKLSDDNNINILTGEQENFYKEKTKFSKEAGVIETLSKLMEENKRIEEYVEIDEYVNALKRFIKNRLQLVEVNGEVK